MAWKDDRNSQTRMFSITREKAVELGYLDAQDDSNGDRLALEAVIWRGMLYVKRYDLDIDDTICSKEDVVEYLKTRFDQHFGEVKDLD